MAVRLSGLSSGLDTEAIIKELMSAQSVKKTKIEKSKTKLEWKEEKWQELNKKIYALYTDELSKLKAQGSYLTKGVTVSDSSKATVTAGSKAPAGTHTIGISSVASSQFVTGAKIESFEGTTVDPSKVTAKTELKSLGIYEGTTFTLTKGSETKEFVVKEKTTIGDLSDFAKQQGVNLSYDTKNQRFFVSSVESGEKNAFALSCKTASADTATELSKVKEEIGYDHFSKAIQKEIDDAMKVIEQNDPQSSEYIAAEEKLQKYSAAYKQTVVDTENNKDITADKFKEILEQNTKEYFDNNKPFTSNDNISNGLVDLKESYKTVTKSALSVLGLCEIKKDGLVQTDGKVTYQAASDCIVNYNGATYRSETNTVEVNGLTIKAIEKTPDDSPIKINVTNDTDSVYKMVKGFVTKYNSILKEVNELLYASSAKGYDVLSDEEREAMTDEQIEKWENKIKNSLLRNDSTLSGVRSTLTSITAITVKVDGKEYSLSSFGIGTAEYSEKGLLHINGDSEDSLTSGKTDKLKAALEDDPDLVMRVMSEIGTELYKKLSDKMASSSVSSAMKFYNDKQITAEKKTYDAEIKKWEKKLSEMEDRYYKKFAAMESAMAKLNSQTNYFMSMFPQ